MKEKFQELLTRAMALKQPLVNERAERQDAVQVLAASILDQEALLRAEIKRLHQQIAPVDRLCVEIAKAITQNMKSDAVLNALSAELVNMEAEHGDVR